MLGLIERRDGSPGIRKGAAPGIAPHIFHAESRERLPAAQEEDISSEHSRVDRAELNQRRIVDCGVARQRFRVLI